LIIFFDFFNERKSLKLVLLCHIVVTCWRF